MSTVAERVLMRHRGAHIVENFLLCYHPSTVVFVDDEESITTMLAFRFDGQFLFQLFTEPRDALEFIEKFKYPNLKQEIVEKLKNSELHRFHFLKLHRMIYDKKRFEMPAVICTDQNMPGLDGFELCSRLVDLPIFKLMFTGKAAFQQCQDAFHTSTIDSFIHKGAGNALEHLDAKREHFQHSFFARLGQDVVLTFILEKGLDSYLFSDNFTGLVKEVYQASHSVERYLLDASGSHLFLTTRGDVNALLVRTDEDIQAAIKANEQASAQERAPEDVMLAIKTGQKILYTGTGDDCSVSPKEWFKFCFDAELHIIGNTKIYYAYISGKLPGIDRSRVVSYDAYLAERKAQGR